MKAIKVLVGLLMLFVVMYCNGVSARYISADPIGLAGGPNPYNYANNNPVNAVDPLGLDVTVGNGQSILHLPDGARFPNGGEGVVSMDGAGSPLGAGGAAINLAPEVKFPIVVGTVAVKALNIGRVQSRINLSNEGWKHMVARHCSGKTNASQFTIPQNELRSLLQNKNIVQSPISEIRESADGLKYVRQVNTGQTIGVDAFNGNQATSTITIMTDGYGNLITAFPGILK